MKKDYKYRMFFSIIAIILIISNICYAAETTSLNTGKTILKLFFNTLIFIVVIIATIYGTKLIAKNSKRFTNGKYMKVIDVLKLDINTKIAIIKIDKMIYILAMTNNNIEVIDKHSEDEFKVRDNIEFEEELNRHRYNCFSTNRYTNKLQRKINKLLNNSNKSVDEEDKNNEKMG